MITAPVSSDDTGREEDAGSRGPRMRTLLRLSRISLSLIELIYSFILNLLLKDGRLIYSLIFFFSCIKFD